MRYIKNKFDLLYAMLRRAAPMGDAELVSTARLSRRWRPATWRERMKARLFSHRGGA